MDASEATQEADWPVRPWIMAGVGAVGGLLFYELVDSIKYNLPITTNMLLLMAAATFVGVATLSFIITAERRRLPWAVAFAVGWGAVMALVGYFTASYDRTGEIMGFPFASGILAVGIAAPLFQTMRDGGRRSLPYESVHRYAWTDGIIGGASLAFTGLTFMLAWLLASLFDSIGIPLLKDLLNKGWFGFMLAGAAFGAASAVLRERDALLGTLQKLVMVVFSVLAPVLAVALGVYLMALPVTGTAGLWKSGLPETPLLLSAAAFAFVLLNAIIGDSSDDRGKGPMWRVTEGVLLFSMLPLGVLALVSMGMRVSQYGWTPERLWGVIACLVAIAYGIAAWLAAARARRDFDVPLRESQKHLAIGLCGVALFLALPIVDFGAISTRSQLARLESGKVKPADFDWPALAFDFGPAGRKALQRVASSGAADQRPFAETALKAEGRYSIANEIETQQTAANLDQRMRVLPEGAAVPQALRDSIADDQTCKDRPCVLMVLSPDQAILAGHPWNAKRMEGTMFERRKDGKWIEKSLYEENRPDNAADPKSATVEVRDITRRQLFVDGKPVGQPFE